MKTTSHHLFSILAVVLTMLAGPAGAEGPWERQSPLPYPPGGFVGVHMLSSDHVVAVTEGTGGFDSALYESVDGGATWSRRDLNMGPDPSYNHIAFFGPDLGFILGNGTASNLRTTDGGATWQAMDAENFGPFTWYGIHFLTADFGYAIGNGMPAFTFDAGVTWSYPTLEGNPNQPYFALQRVGGFSTDLAVGLGAGDLGIWRTTNQGQYWRLVYPGEGIGAIKMLTDQVALAFRQDSVLRTTNGGQSWTSINLPASGSWQPLVFSPSIIVAVHWDGTAIRSTNGGRTWQLRDTPLHAFVTDFELLNPQTALASQLIGGNVHVVYRTNDAGSTWTPVGPNPASTIWSMDFADSLNGFALGGDNMRLRTRDGGITWDKLNTGTMNYVDDVLMFDTRNGLAVGQNWILRTTDGGARWKYDEFITDELFDIDQLPSGKLVAAGSLSRFQTSSDGGQTWNVSRPLGNNTLLEVEFVSDQEGWATTGYDTYGMIFHTTDGGANWTLQFGPTLSSYSAIDFFNNQIGVVGGTMSGFLRTSNGGANWQYIQTTGGHEIYAVHFFDADSLLVAGSGGYVARSDNFGNTWQVFNTGITNAITALEVIDQNTWWLAGTNGITLHTTNAGQSWTVEDTENATPYFNSFLALDALPSGDVWAVGEFGAIYHRAPTGGEAVEAPLVGFSVPDGTRVSGHLRSLNDRDGNTLQIQSERMPNGQNWATINVRAQSGSTDLARLDVTTVTSASMPGVTARVWIRDYQANRWVLLGSFAQSTSETVRAFSDLPNPSAYVNPVNGQITLRIRQSSLLDPFVMRVNQVQVDVVPRL